MISAAKNENQIPEAPVTRLRIRDGLLSTYADVLTAEALEALEALGHLGQGLAARGPGGELLLLGYVFNFITYATPSSCRSCWTPTARSW